MIPSLVKLNATCWASGDIRGLSMPSISKSTFSLPPAAATDQILRRPSRSDRKASCLLSGYQLGTLPPSVVTWLRFPPSASAIQRSEAVPLRYAWKAILDPSGENAGAIWRVPGGLVRKVGEPAGSCVSGAMGTEIRLLVEAD